MSLGNSLTVRFSSVSAGTELNQFCFCRNCPDITCTECGRAGHMRRICPFRVRYYPKDKAEAAELRKQKTVKVGQFNQESGEIEEAGEWEAAE